MKISASKKTRVIAVVALTVLASSLGMQFAEAAAPVRYISVSSTGTVKVTPDAVRLNASVSAIAKVSKEALTNANIAADKFRTSILANGIDKKNLASTTLTVYPEYNYTQETGNVLIGYRASQSFEVVIRNAAKAGEIVDAVVASAGDALYINGVTPLVYDNSKATEAARISAVKSAKAKANSYAKLLGVKIGKIINLQESSAPSSYPISMVQAKSDAGATEIDLGQQDVSVSVSTKWAIS
ncbi:COG2968 Uncharacterized conserved protein [actinobacterium SCGC AAA044-D11]